MRYLPLLLLLASCAADPYDASVPTNLRIESWRKPYQCPMSLSDGKLACVVSQAPPDCPDPDERKPA